MIYIRVFNCTEDTFFRMTEIYTELEVRMYSGQADFVKVNLTKLFNNTFFKDCPIKSF